MTTKVRSLQHNAITDEMQTVFSVKFKSKRKSALVSIFQGLVNVLGTKIFYGWFVQKVLTRSTRIIFALQLDLFSRCCCYVVFLLLIFYCLVAESIDFLQCSISWGCIVCSIKLGNSMGCWTSVYS